VVAGLGAVVTHKTRLLLPVAEKLATQPAGQAFSPIEVDKMLRKIGRATLWGQAVASVFVALPLAGLLWAGFALLL
jgi:hypothetical protein